MADPILLHDCPELRARAEAVFLIRHSYLPYTVHTREECIAGILAELRDLSTPTGRDHACRWLWALLTGEEQEWCPGWIRISAIGFKVCSVSTRYANINVVAPGAERPHGAVVEEYGGEFWIYLANLNSMTPTEALAAAITAAVDWRRGQP